MASDTQVVSASQINLSNLNSMQLALEGNKRLESLMDEQATQYHTIDVRDAMNKLVSVGKVLKLAYAGSKGFPCSKNTIAMLSNYQSLIKNSFVTASSFVDATLSALKCHKLALTLAEKDKFDRALEMIHKCSELASKMANESEKLVLEATKLSDLASEALQSATNDETLSIQEKNKIAEMITDNKAKEERLKKKIENLCHQITEAKEEQDRLAQLAKEQRSTELTFKVISTVLSPLIKMTEAVSAGLGANKSYGKTEQGHNPLLKTLNEEFDALKSKIKVLENKILKAKKEKKPQEEIDDLVNEEENLEALKKELSNKMIDSGKSAGSGNVDPNNNTNTALDKLYEQEMFIMKLKSELQKEQREANADIAEVGTRLKNLDQTKNDLSASICSLEMAIKALGKITTTFRLTKQFWEGVKTQCEKLKDKSVLEALNDPGLKDEFIEELKSSGLSWLILGRINYTAMVSMKTVDAETDSIMNNIPNKIEAIELIRNEADAIINDIVS